MRFSPSHWLGAGVGWLSVDLQQIGQGFFLGWRGPDRFLANAPSREGVDDFRLYEYFRAGGTWARLELDPRGATRAAAGGRNYAVMLAAKSGLVIYGEFEGAPLPADVSRATGLDGAPDGRLLFASEDYQSLGVLTPGQGVRWYATGPHVNMETPRLSPNGFVYYDEAHPKCLMVQRATFPPAPVPVMDTPLTPSLVLVDDAEWVLYHNDETFFHPLGSTKGYRMPGSYGPDVVLMEGVGASVALSSSPGEGWDSISFHVIPTLGEGMQDLTPRASLPTFVFNHPVMVAPFKDPNGDTAAPAEVVANQTGQRRKRPFFACSDSLDGPFAGEMLGVYEEKPERVDLLMKEAARLKTRAVFCHDLITPPEVPGQLRPGDQFWWELYRYKNEDLKTSVARWRKDAALAIASWPGDLGVVPMFYCKGGRPGGDPPEEWSVVEVLEGLDYLAEIVNLSPRIKVIAPFSYLRANGIVAHPELFDTFQVLLVAAAKAGMPTLLAPGERPAPERPVEKPRDPVPTPSQPTPDPEEFTAMDLHNKTVVVTLPRGTYDPETDRHDSMLSAKEGGGLGIFETRPNNWREGKGGGWEHFKIVVQPDGRVGLKTDNGKAWVSVKADPVIWNGNPMEMLEEREATSDHVGGLEAFYVKKVSDRSAILTVLWTSAGKIYAPLSLFVEFV